MRFGRICAKSEALYSAVRLAVVADVRVDGLAPRDMVLRVVVFRLRCQRREETFLLEKLVVNDFNFAGSPRAASLTHRFD